MKGARSYESAGCQGPQVPVRHRRAWRAHRGGEHGVLQDALGALVHRYVLGFICMLLGAMAGYAAFEERASKRGDDSK